LALALTVTTQFDLSRDESEGGQLQYICVPPKPSPIVALDSRLFEPFV